MTAKTYLSVVRFDLHNCAATSLDRSQIPNLSVWRLGDSECGAVLRSRRTVHLPCFHRDCASLLGPRPRDEGRHLFIDHSVWDDTARGECAFSNVDLVFLIVILCVCV